MGDNLSGLGRLSVFSKLSSNRVTAMVAIDLCVMEFDVSEQQPALIDPSTGRTLGTPDRLPGTIRVEDVQDKYSVAAAVNGAGFKRNHLLRFKGQKEMS